MKKNVHTIEKILLIDNVKHADHSLDPVRTNFPGALAVNSTQPTHHGKYQSPLNVQHLRHHEATAGSQPVKTCFRYVVKHDQSFPTTTEGSEKLSEVGGKIITINMLPTWETVKLIIALSGMFDVICSF